MDCLRVGALGAARITPAALIKPARQVPEVEVTAVAARDPALADAYAAAARHPPRCTTPTRSCVADPGIDVVYNPLPNWPARAGGR